MQIVAGKALSFSTKKYIFHLFFQGKTKWCFYLVIIANMAPVTLNSEEH